ncbi:glycosyltransferase [Sphingomonas turrisvirgatae]|uniref:Dolichol monophosphate mannose synthase n=1 Tax=Sphingomonas turrisvirgatae TaxID=1888892 RepID=A0A1E3LUL4_9SPHN|nr:glycosyltransferase family 2 protein [Sphingomonas turrisvirgatae]ODP36510.1 dolichol monophosphate mannose synthase [Sphingomonas turrisvirgatae]
MPDPECVAPPAALLSLHHPPELAVIVPTFNERDNVRALTEAVAHALSGTSFEIIFVDDDSSDGTREVLSQIAAERGNIRMIHRIGRRGLSTAVTEGMLSTTAPYVAVIDADMQHDERILPDMLRLLRDGEADLVIGSRYVEGGGIGEWDAKRATVSSTATKLAKLITSADITDPMSGFFAITRPALNGAVRSLSGQGYKILLDIAASTQAPLRIRELPYHFRTRQHGESKLDALIVWEYLLLLVDKLIGHIVPARFVSFMFIGGLGVFVHMGVLGTMGAVGASFLWAQASATIIAMVFNFFVNNTLTYRDRRLKGFVPVTRGLLTFMLVCAVGAFANVGIADYLFSDYHYGWLSAGLAGILVGVVWNYATSSVVTWRSR